MKQLPITSPHYRYTLQAFKEWLDVLGYAETTVYKLPLHVQEMLHYFEQQGKSQLHDIDNTLIKAHYRQLKQRSNLTRGGGLGNGSLNKHLQAINVFSDYLRQSGRLQLPKLYIPKEERDSKQIDTLTEAEIQQLYKATEQYEAEKESKNIPHLYEALAKRDKAMLTIFYGCGLRRNEGVHLDISDILTDKYCIHVRKGKGNKERLVPINSKGMQYLQDYLYESRPYFIRDNKAEMFFVSQRGKRINGQSLLLRLKQLIERTANTALQQKEVGLHTLRHSIATHLLTNGMQLEAIAKFLGHDSLESTQIYTHLTQQENEASGKHLC